MSNLAWAISSILFSIPFAIRGVVFALISRQVLKFYSNHPIAAQFCSLLMAIAIVSAFPPLRQSGNWQEKQTAQPASAFISYQLDKRWFGIFPYYRFPGTDAPSRSVSVEYQPWSHLPAYKMTKKSSTIDYPILITEVFLLITYGTLHTIRKTTPIAPAKRIPPSRPPSINRSSLFLEWIWLTTHTLKMVPPAKNA